MHIKKSANADAFISLGQTTSATPEKVFEEIFQPSGGLRICVVHPRASQSRRRRFARAWVISSDGVRASGTFFTLNWIQTTLLPAAGMPIRLRCRGGFANP